MVAPMARARLTRARRLGMAAILGNSQLLFDSSNISNEGRASGRCRREMRATPSLVAVDSWVRCSPSNISTKQTSGASRMTSAMRCSRGSLICAASNSIACGRPSRQNCSASATLATTSTSMPMCRTAAWASLRSSRFADKISSWQPAKGRELPPMRCASASSRAWVWSGAGASSGASWLNSRVNSVMPESCSRSGSTPRVMAVCSSSRQANESRPGDASRASGSLPSRSSGRCAKRQLSRALTGQGVRSRRRSTEECVLARAQSISALSSANSKAPSAQISTGLSDWRTCTPRACVSRLRWASTLRSICARCWRSRFSRSRPEARRASCCPSMPAVRASSTLRRSSRSPRRSIWPVVARF
mmetsp:Transcript_9919/g.23258  ORF Transcript_9919/g.23258 Transcript_9919/m.23258 type:complete len:361 (+) Transcript_9919:2859-3941(+)